MPETGQTVGMAGKTAKDYEQDYTKPKLRARLKEEIQAGDKGGKKGQWSARKSQLLTQEYEKHGGDYKHKGKRTSSQKHLEQWGDQDWKTAKGDADARGEDGTSRYLPDAAWKLLSKDERKATERKKKGKKDEQHVANTKAAKEARKAAQLLDMNARDARKAVRGMDTKSELKRAKKAEDKLGKGRKTVLEAISAQRERVASEKR
jgi:hypothetical protein